MNNIKGLSEKKFIEVGDFNAQLLNEIAKDSLADKIEAFKKTESMNEIRSKIQREANNGKFEVRLNNEDFAEYGTKLLVTRILQDGGFQITHGFSWITVSWFTQNNEVTEDE